MTSRFHRGGLFRICLLALLLITGASAQTKWISAQRVGNSAIFLFADPPRFERFDLAARTWLPAIPLSSDFGPPTCSWVDADGLYVTYGGRAVYKHDLSGGSTTHLINTTHDISGLLTDGDTLFINFVEYSPSQFTSISKSTGAIIGTYDRLFYSLQGLSIAPTLGKIFGRSRGISPSDIIYANYDATGKVVGGSDSPHHGDFADASKTWIFPSEQRVVDSSGTIYTTAALEYVGSLGTKVDDIQFPSGSGPIVLRGNSLSAYTNNLLPSGTLTLPFKPGCFHLSGTDAIIFRVDSTQQHGVRTQAIPLSGIVPPPVTGGVDPNGLVYTPDAVLQANDGTVLLVSKAHNSIFRWSPVTRQYAATIPLANVPEYSAYSPAKNSIYVVDAAGIIRSIDLATATPVEMPFAILPQTPLGLAVVGNFIFSVDYSGAWCTHRTFNAAGVQVSSKDWNYYSGEYTWSEASQKIYLFRDNYPSDLAWEEINANGTAYPGLAAGEIGNKRDSNFSSSNSFRYPIRVSPDGSKVLVGSGAFLDSNSLAILPIALPVNINDAVWHGGQIKTLRTVTDHSAVESWTGPTLAKGKSSQLLGSAIRLLPLDESRLISICRSPLGSPIFNLLDDNLQIIPPDSLATPVNLSITSPKSAQLLLEWADVTGELGYIVQRKPVSSTSWEVLGETGESENALTFGTITAAETYDYRVIARHGNLLSAPSAPLENVLSGPPPTPENFAVKSTGQTSVSFVWSDGELEDRYVIESIYPSGGWDSVVHAKENATSAKVIVRAPDSKYEFRIAARNPLGLSGWAYVTAKTQPGQGEIDVVSLPGKVPLKDRVSIQDFGSMTVGGGNKSRVVIRIRNIGSYELRNLKLRITGPQKGDFRFTRLKKTVLASGESQTFEVVFYALKKGTRAAVLEILSSDTNESPFQLRLLGEGSERIIITN